jgi:hypothetical protein
MHDENKNEATQVASGVYRRRPDSGALVVNTAQSEANTAHDVVASTRERSEWFLAWAKTHPEATVAEAREAVRNHFQGLGLGTTFLNVTLNHIRDMNDLPKRKRGRRGLRMDLGAPEVPKRRTLEEIVQELRSHGVRHVIIGEVNYTVELAGTLSK